MSETAQRWKARVGSLKGLSFMILVGIASLWFAMGEEILQSLQGQTAPARLTIGSLHAGGAESTAYVTVSGFAYYDLGYEETSDDRVVTSYYLLVDQATGESVIVRAEALDVVEQEPAPAEVSGMVQRTPADLEAVVVDDLSWLSKQGIAVDPSIFLAAGERPLPALLGLGLLGVSLLLGVLCLPPFLLPSVVFYPKPIDPSTSAAAARPAADAPQASGRFQQIKRLEPTLEFGKRRQRFHAAAANLIQLPDGDLLVYIHYLLRTRLYGVVTVGKHESDWGVVVRRADAWQIEPGRLLGWKDRPALRLLRQEIGRKPETLYLALADGRAQAELVQSLRGSGFPVGMGIGP